MMLGVTECIDLTWVSVSVSLQYISDYLEFLDNLEKGFFIQHTLANILLDTDGAQLMCEALYLYGVILLLLDRKIPGPTREDGHRVLPKQGRIGAGKY